LKSENCITEKRVTELHEGCTKFHNEGDPVKGEMFIKNDDEKLYEPRRGDIVGYKGIMESWNNAPIKIIGISHKTLKNDGKVGAQNEKAEVPDR